MRAGTHAVRWSATSGGALTPPLCRRVARVQLIQCQCKLQLQIANLGINNVFLIKPSLFDHAVYISHLVQTPGHFRSESKARDW